LGMIQTTSTYFYKKSKSEFANSFTTSFIIALFFTIISIIVLYLSKNYIQSKFDFPTQFIFLIPFLVFLTFSSEQVFTVMRNRNEVKQYTILGISKSIVEYGVSVILIVVLFQGWLGRIWGITISLILINIFALYYFYKNDYLHFKFNKQIIWEEIKFGAPVLVYQLSIFLAGSSNKLILAAYNVDKGELGIYSIACVLGSMIGVIAQSVMLYIQPKLFKSISSGQATLQSVKHDFFSLVKILTAFSLVCVVVVLFAYAFVINKVYSKGIMYFFIVAIGSYIWNLNNYIFLFLLYHRQKKKILYISLLSIVFSLSINIYLVKKFLILGDAFASLIGTVIFVVLTCLFSYKLIITSLLKKEPTEQIG
jgi:O-antigen/teichoic acid export membrane protein